MSSEQSEQTNNNETTQSLETENQSLKSKIEELNEMISLQQYYIDEYREKYEEEKEEHDLLKQEIKRIRIMEQQNIALNETIHKKDEIINEKNKIIYNLQHPSKWQWCDFNGYIWKDFDNKLSKQMDKNYTNNNTTYRHQLNKTELYEFQFNEKTQKMDNNRHINHINIDTNESKSNDSNHSNNLCNAHKMKYFTKNSMINVYFIKRVSMDYKSNYLLNGNIWKGPARKTFGNKIMRLYHVTDKYAADIINKTRNMKCGKTGRFGAGIYFAEKITTAQKRAHHKGYIVTAKVLVGNEYIIKENDQGQVDASLNFQKLQNKNFDSIYAVHWTERVVYNSDQVFVVDIKRMSAFEFIFKS